jgi:tripartite-type tricarboxylate transporter receptor subunit TctC
MNNKLSVVCLTLLGVALAAAVAGASTDDFFRNKTVRIIVGFAPGGGFDTYSRAIARHFGKHIPGNPSVVVENMTGAGSLIAANYLYKIAKPDGLTIGNFHGNQIINQIIGGAGIEFDARRFQWIGVPVKDTGACVVTKASGITSLERWRAAKTPVKLGGGASGDTASVSAKILREALGLPIQLVMGYKGTSEMRLAAESGELAGACFQWESIKTTWRKGLDTGESLVALQINPKPHPELAQVPNAIDFAKTEEARQLIRFGIHEPAAITRPYGLPPATPLERVAALRQAFLNTFKDPDFIADSGKAKLESDPLSGADLERLIASFFKLDPVILGKLKEALK